MKKMYIVLLVILYLFYLFNITYKNEKIKTKSVYITGELVTVNRINNKILLKTIYEDKEYNISKNGHYTLYFSDDKLIYYNNSIFNKIRWYVEDKLDKRFSYSLSSYAKALLLYDKSYLLKEDKEIIRKLGISHIFSLSAFHLTLIYMIILSLLSKISNNKREIIAFLLISIYVLIIGFIPSITRAYIMISILSLSKILKENADTKKSLLISFSITALLNPYQIINISYILSYLITYVIILCKDKSILIKNIVIELVSFPLIFFTFRSFNFLMFLINLIMLPLFTVLIYLIIFCLFFNFSVIIMFLEEYFKLILNIMKALSLIDFFTISY